MEAPKNIKVLITNLPNEVIGYYKSGRKTLLFYSMPISYLAMLVYHLHPFIGIALVALALFPWYKVFSKSIYFIINNRCIAVQSGLSSFIETYEWSEISAFHFTVKVVTNRDGSRVENKIVFERKNGERDLVLDLFGMEKQFNEIYDKVERLANEHKITNGGIVQL